VPEHFRIGPEIVHETVDGEVIAIDLDNGSYYSLAGSGPLVWSLLADGASEVELRDALEARFGAVETIAGDVSTLLEQLRENGLIVETEREADIATLMAKAGDSETYEAPRFERYTDMKDYFLLDPIHEVDRAGGWPRPAA
jgi:Coenzyme PQQ synthesis protein D (PqqD)